MKNLQMNDESADTPSRSKKLRVALLIMSLILGIGFLLVGIYWVASISGQILMKGVTDFCTSRVVNPRAEPVRTEPLLQLEISPQVDLNRWQGWDEAIGTFPLGENRANTFIKRFISTEDARINLEHGCEKGWGFERDNRYNRDYLQYGGQKDNRYCISPVLESRRDTMYLCSPSGVYMSYVIFQKKDVVIAIFEYDQRGSDYIGASTNQSIEEVIAALSGAGNTD